MNDRAAFKFAFLMECARDGLSEVEIVARIDRLEKRAGGGADAATSMFGGVGKMLLGGAGSAIGGIGGLLKDVAVHAVPVAIGGAAVTGGLIGLGAAKTQEGHFDEDAAKKQELIATYNSFRDELEQHRKSRPASNTRRVSLN